MERIPRFYLNVGVREMGTMDQEQTILAEESDLMIRKKFTSHLLDRQGIEKTKTIRRHARSLAAAIEILCPDGKEKESAFLSLQTVMMHSNCSIAQEYPIDPTDI